MEDLRKQGVEYGEYLRVLEVLEQGTEGSEAKIHRNVL